MNKAANGRFIATRTTKPAGVTTRGALVVQEAGRGCDTNALDCSKHGECVRGRVLCTGGWTSTARRRRPDGCHELAVSGVCKWTTRALRGRRCRRRLSRRLQKAPACDGGWEGAGCASVRAWTIARATATANGACYCETHNPTGARRMAHLPSSVCAC